MACKSLSGDLGREAEEDRAPIICPVLPRVRPESEGGGVAEEVEPPPLKYDLIPAFSEQSKKKCEVRKAVNNMQIQ